MAQLSRLSRSNHCLRLSKYFEKAPAIGRSSSSYCQATQPTLLPIKAGTPIQGLDFVKGKDPVVALERSDYPEFVDKLATPPPSLAKLRRMPDEEADDKLQKRFLKLKRRAVIKANNRSLAK